MVLLICLVVFGLPLVFVKSKYKILDSIGVSLLIYLFLFIVGVPLIDQFGGAGIHNSFMDGLLKFLILGMGYWFLAAMVWLAVRVTLEWKDKRKVSRP